jgi:hypothetical protein
LAHPYELIGTHSYIGKSHFSQPETQGYGYNDPNFSGMISGFKVYRTILDDSAIAAEANIANAPSAERTNLVRKLKEAVDGADKSAFESVVSDIDMPASPDNDVLFSWASSAPSVLDGNGAYGTVAGDSETVTLTVTAAIPDSDVYFSNHPIRYSKGFPATVRGSEFVLAEDYAALGLMTLIDTTVFHLPLKGKYGADITWTSSDTTVLDPSKRYPEENVYQNEPGGGTKYVDLTAVLSYNGQTMTKQFPKRMVMEKYNAFLLTYFGGNEISGPESEYAKVHFAYSYDGLHWVALNGNNHVVAATILGREDPSYGQDRRDEALARDPMVYRQQDGLLRLISSHSWNNHDIYVWDAGDLTSFSGERILSVNTSKGNAWAPECVWDPVLEKNLIIFTDPGTPYNGGYGTYTTDFTQADVNANKELGLTNMPLLDMSGTAVVRYIDCSMYYYNGTYYMPVRYWSGQPVDGVAMAKASYLGPKSFTSMNPAASVGYGNNEGPFVIKALDRERWYLYYDYPDSGNDDVSAGSGVFGVSYTDDINDPDGWHRVPYDDYQMPIGVRHGNAIPITQGELAKLIDKWGAPDTLSVSMLSEPEVTVAEGTPFESLELPSEVEVTLLDGTTESIPVTNWDPANYSSESGRCKLYGTFDLSALTKISNPKNYLPYVNVYVGDYAKRKGLITDIGFEDAGGNKALDKSGFGNTLTVSEGITIEDTTRPGGSGKMLVANGAVSGEFPKELMMNTSDITIAFWARPTESREWARIIDLGKGTSNYINFIGKDNGATGDSSHSSGMRVEIKVFNEVRTIETQNELPVNKWTHIAITLNPKTRTGKLYVDGLLAAQNTDVFYSPANLGMSGRNFLLKSQYGDTPYKGNLDDLKIYDYVLTPTQVLELYSDNDELIVEKTLMKDEKTVSADVAIRNNTGENREILCLLAAYSSGSLLSISSKVVYSAEKSVDSTHLEFVLTDVPGAESYTLFIWDNETSAPLADKAQLN